MLRAYQEATGKTQMHKEEVEINGDIVRKLIAEQFPQFASFPIHKVHSTGTVNAVYRLGEEYCARLPRLSRAGKSFNNEWIVLPVISPSITLTVPQIIEKGKPSAEYPLDWGIYRWIQGDVYGSVPIDEAEAAEALAQFVTELSKVKPFDNAPKAGRKPLLDLDEITLNAVTECGSDIDRQRILEIWRKLLRVKPWEGTPVWIHADLLKPNLLVRGGKLFGVIDFGSAGIGDPAFDIIPAWTVLSSDQARALFRRLLNVDCDTWNRAKAYALHQALLIIPYYRYTNPVLAEQAKDTVNNIIKETYYVL